MSKELKAFERIKNITYDRTDLYGIEEYRKALDIIETALKANQERIEELEETNHLMFIREHENTKKLKALEIIKEIIPIEEEDFFYDKETDTYFFIGHKVSEEQYGLLKEVLL